MASRPSPKTSFSRSRRWSILFSVIASIVAVIALVGMLNYLAARHYTRFSWSSRTKAQLSPQTLNLLNSITNDIKVTVYFDKKHELYTLVDSLLSEYHGKNRHISIETVDYVNNPAGAEKVKATYGLRSAAQKDLVIFEANGRTNYVEQSFLGDYTIDPQQNEKGEREFRYVLKSFKGELYFNAALLRVTSTKPFKAYFVAPHKLSSLISTEKDGYNKLVELLQQNYIQPAVITNLVGTNTVPADCNLLVVLATRTPFFPEEVDNIRKYLNQGGRMLFLLNFTSEKDNLGMEKFLAEDWNVEIGHNIVRDMENSQKDGVDLIISGFNKNSPIVSSLLDSSVQLYQPRSISKRDTGKQNADAPKVEELAFTSANAIIENSSAPHNKPIPLMVSVEKGAIKGVYAERGVTRMVIGGDSIFLNNYYIGSGDNQLLAVNIFNWLLDRTQLMQGVAPQQVTEYKIMMTRSQFRDVEWILLAAMPGGVMLLGGIVWLRRRK